MQAKVESGRLAIVPREDTAEALLPFDLTFGCWRKVRSENFVLVFFSLMRSFVIVVRQPLP